MKCYKGQRYQECVGEANQGKCRSRAQLDVHLPVVMVVARLRDVGT